MIDVGAASKIRLDLGCGANLQPGWVGMDIRSLDHDPARFLCHDIEATPWPLPDDCADIIQASHIMEHVSAVSYRLENGELVRRNGFIDVMNEMWRVLCHEGQVWVTGPYGWSHGFIQDPTHVKPLNESLFTYFTPRDWTGAPSGLYGIYEPRPWRWQQPPQFSLGGNILVILNALKE